MIALISLLLWVGAILAGNEVPAPFQASVKSRRLVLVIQTHSHGRCVLMDGSLVEFGNWLQNTSFALAVATSTWAYQFVQATHFTGLSFVDWNDLPRR